MKHLKHVVVGKHKQFKVFAIIKNTSCLTIQRISSMPPLAVDEFLLHAAIGGHWCLQVGVGENSATMSQNWEATTNTCEFIAMHCNHQICNSRHCSFGGGVPPWAWSRYSVPLVVIHMAARNCRLLGSGKQSNGTLPGLLGGYPTLRDNWKQLRVISIRTQRHLGAFMLTIYAPNRNRHTPLSSLPIVLC